MMAFTVSLSNYNVNKHIFTIGLRVERLIHTIAADNAHSFLLMFQKLRILLLYATKIFFFCTKESFNSFESEWSTYSVENLNPIKVQINCICQQEPCNVFGSR